MSKHVNDRKVALKRLVAELGVLSRCKLLELQREGVALFEPVFGQINAGTFRGDIGLCSDCRANGSDVVGAGSVAVQC